MNIYQNARGDHRRRRKIQRKHGEVSTWFGGTGASASNIINIFADDLYIRHACAAAARIFNYRGVYRAAFRYTLRTGVTSPTVYCGVPASISVDTCLYHRASATPHLPAHTSRQHGCYATCVDDGWAGSCALHIFFCGAVVLDRTGSRGFSGSVAAHAARCGCGLHACVTCTAVGTFTRRAIDVAGL